MLAISAAPLACVAFNCSFGDIETVSLITLWKLCGFLWFFFFKWDVPWNNVNLKKKFFLNCFWWNTSPYYFTFFLCRPSEESLQRSAIPDGSPSQDWQSTVGWGDCWIWTQDCSFTIWCRYQWATTDFEKRAIDVKKMPFIDLSAVQLRPVFLDICKYLTKASTASTMSYSVLWIFSLHLESSESK